MPSPSADNDRRIAAVITWLIEMAIDAVALVVALTLALIGAAHLGNADGSPMQGTPWPSMAWALAGITLLALFLRRHK